MKMVSIFKDFVTTYNRTYKTKEGEESALVIPVPIRSGPFLQLGTLVLGKRRTEDAVNPFKGP